jgi:hypothetical protein
MKRLLFVLIILTVAIVAPAQKKWQKMGLKPLPPVCYASEEVEKTYIPPPAEVLKRLKSAEKKSDFIVDYVLFPPKAITAFDYAVSIWESIIESPVPIHIEARWLNKQQNVLGSCAPSDYEMNIEGAPWENVYYPIAAAEKILGYELTGSGRPDMNAEFNKNVNWYFGTDGQTPDSLYDFVTVVLHEIGHGLGFTGFFYVQNNIGSYGYWQNGDITTFDRLVAKSNGNLLIDTTRFANPSSELKTALTSQFLFARSPAAYTDGNQNFPRLYAPLTWDGGSSVYHLNDANYPSSNPNSLMTHAIGKGEAIHDPGPLTNGILADVGWKIMKIDFREIKDQEEVQPVHFEAEIISDYSIDTTALFVVYSSDSFENNRDSVRLISSETGTFEAQVIPPPETEFLSYYIKAGDVKNRKFYQPKGGPEKFYTLNFGPDELPPVISHEPIPYYFTIDDSLQIQAEVNDNLGIDTVYIEYSVNGIQQTPFGLKADSLRGTYSGYFNFNPAQLSDGDEIAYKVIAVDASTAQNIRQDPVRNNHVFNVDKVAEPIGSYVNDFNNVSNDFILTDFDIYTETNFENAALHSPHPYPSPDQDDIEFNFSTILKYPIILSEDAVMTFDEIVLVEPGEIGTGYGDFEFWDYVIVEGSNDEGKTWLPLENGYDARASSTWLENYNKLTEEMNSTSAGEPGMFINREINMTENGNFAAGDTILIRFRLFSEPYAHGWGWAIDNLRIQQPVTAPAPLLSPGNVAAFPNPFNHSFTVRIEPKTKIENLTIEIYNMFGQKIKSISRQNVLGVFSEEISVDQGINGMYLLSVKENGLPVLTKKMMKIK